MSIMINYDARSDISCVFSVEYIDGKRKATQIGSIRASDREAYSKNDEPIIYSFKPENRLAVIALNELLRFHDVVLHRTYRFRHHAALKELNLSAEDNQKIDDEIKRMTLNWQKALRGVLSCDVRSYAIEERIKPEKILKDLNRLFKSR